ncbi:MAG: alpha/beta hydrolase [Burkholderiales bacterium]
MRSVLERMARAGHPRLDTLSPREAKAAYEIGASVLDLRKAPLERVEDIAIPARDGHLLPLRIYAPSRAAGLPVLLYFHGGGFVIGSIATHDVLCRELARLSGAMVCSLDYRLAPEHKFPAAVHDCEDALHWLSANAASIGADAGRIAIGGDSAGGTLTAACALLARDSDLPLVLQLKFYPGCAARQDSLSHYRFGSGLVLEAPTIRWFFDQYLRTPADRDDWRFAPLNAPDAEGVAPAWIGLAEFDPLVDEGLQYADKLRAAGVAVDLEIYRGVTHDFIKMGRAVPEALQAHQDAARALRRAFATR